MDSSDHLSLQTQDYVVFVVIMVLTMAIGIRYAIAGQGSRSRESYFVGDRNMHLIPVAFSLMATYESSIMMLGLPAEVYLFGVSVVIIMLGNAVAHLLTAYISVPLFRPQKIASSYEYLQRRFHSRKLRLCGVLLYLVSFLLYLGIVLYAQSVALEAVMGVNKWISIVVMAAVAVIYTSLGGIKSVVWTDAFQTIVMFTGIFAVIIKGTIEAGGTQKVWEQAHATKRLELFNMVLMATILHLAISLLTIYEGLVVYAFFANRDVEPLTCGLITNPNQILPYAVLVLFKNLPGMTGLFMVALYSSSLSTISSGLSSMSILVMEDLLQPFLKNTSEARQTMYAKISVLFLGTGSVLFCVASTLVKGPLNQITVTVLSASFAPTVGLFLLASFFPSSTTRGTFIGVAAGSAMTLLLTVGSTFGPNIKTTEWLPLGNGTCDVDTVSNLTSSTIDVITNITSTPITIMNGDTEESYNKFFSISYILFAPVGIVVTVVVGIASSYVIGRNRPGDVDPRYFIEVSESLLIFLPSRLRRWLKSLGPQFKDGWKKEHPIEDELEPLPDVTVIQETHT